VINLRVSTKKLRRNFILRETVLVNFISHTYTEIVPNGSSKTVFQLPETIPYRLATETIMFPSLPVVRDYDTLATIDDVIVEVGGTPGVISSLDPIMGLVELVSPVVGGQTVSFTYNIRSIGQVAFIDQENSRTFDWVQVFPSICYDGFKDVITLKMSEYVNYLSDYGAGIKSKYFNKDTFQIEEYVFNGPVFESYDSHEDQISSPEDFPNALVKIHSPLSSTDPLNLIMNYDFLNESSVRVRKKTIRELLPDRSFKVSTITEVLPV
jgi:hypothetical protein